MSQGGALVLILFLDSVDARSLGACTRLSQGFCTCRGAIFPGHVPFWRPKSFHLPTLCSHHFLKVDLLSITIC